MQSMIVLEMVQPKHILKQFPFLRSFVNIWFSQSVALATERVHQKRFYTEQGEIPLLFLRPRGCVYFIFPHIITVVRQSSRGRTFSAVTKKWFYVHHPKIAHDLGIVVPRACAKIKKNLLSVYSVTRPGRHGPGPAALPCPRSTSSTLLYYDISHGTVQYVLYCTVL